MPRNWHAGPRFVIIYSSESLALKKYQNAISPEIEVVEQDRHAFFLHGSFPVIWWRASHSFRVGE